MTSVAGQREAARSQRVAGTLPGREVDALLVTAPVNVRYVSGFTGSSGSALLMSDADGAGRGHRFFTDFRYETQSAEQLPGSFEREIVSGNLLDAAARSLEGSTGTLGFDEASMTVADHARLRAALPGRWELQPCGGVIESFRAVKDEFELERIKTAAELADEALSDILEAGLVGRTEHEVAVELELRMRQLGANGPSFPTIVAAGEHAALPHAQPRARPIAKDVLVTIDWGAFHEGYCSDCTRTYATGENIESHARNVYELVLAAQEAGLAAVEAGPTGREVDAVARAVIEAADQGEHFGHGLGHGVGMEIHEAPRLSRTDGREHLRAGNVVTVEPGVYLPGELGVRIEDLVVAREDGREVLNGLPKALTVVG